MTDPLTVACPVCLAGPAVPCFEPRALFAGFPHGGRYTAAQGQDERTNR